MHTENQNPEDKMGQFSSEFTRHTWCRTFALKRLQTEESKQGQGGLKQEDLEVGLNI